MKLSKNETEGEETWEVCVHVLLAVWVMMNEHPQKKKDHQKQKNAVDMTV